MAAHCRLCQPDSRDCVRLSQASLPQFSLHLRNKAEYDRLYGTGKRSCLSHDDRVSFRSKTEQVLVLELRRFDVNGRHGIAAI